LHDDGTEERALDSPRYRAHLRALDASSLDDRLDWLHFVLRDPDCRIADSLNPSRAFLHADLLLSPGWMIDTQAQARALCLQPKGTGAHALGRELTDAIDDARREFLKRKRGAPTGNKNRTKRVA
jgi:hypothetical protein